MIQTVDGKYPDKHKSAYVHPSAILVGDVTLGKESGIWPCAVLRGDMGSITIGEKTNIQDGCVLHATEIKLSVGSQVTVGHGALLHSCDIGDRSVIGMGAIILDAAKIGEDCIIAAGTIIPGGKVIPPRSVVMGNPYQIVREVTQQDIDGAAKNCEEYCLLAKTYIRTGDIL
ncbi:MAG: gamma carbonic anhydrase family protein [Christensenellales bacterium]|jgi:carbonic anhydrase/acetyltransferase-like protein (isoleucine patch superfamily)